MFNYIFAAGTVLSILTTSVYAGSPPTSVLDIPAMPGKPVWGGLAKVTPLAFNDEKKPSIVILRLKKGTVADTPHSTKDGRIRFATVLSGTMFYADGDTVNQAKEVPYPAGSVLLISSGTKHWLSAHNDDVVVMLTAVKPENLAPPVKAQMSK